MVCTSNECEFLHFEPVLKVMIHMAICIDAM